MHTTKMMSLMLIVVALVPVSLGVGIWLVLRGLRRGPAFPSCGKCGYDVSGSIGSVIRCPECGSAFAEVGILKPGGRRRPHLIVVAVVLVILAVGSVGMAGSLLGVVQAKRARAQAIAAQQAAAEAATAADEAAASDDDETPEQDPSG